MRKAIYLCIFAAFFSCSPPPVPKGILPPDEMQKVVGDMIQVDEYINNFLLPDTAIEKKRTVYYEQVFKMHNTDRKQFYSSFKYYEQHPDIQKALFDSLYNQVNRMKNERNSAAPSIKK